MSLWRNIVNLLRPKPRNIGFGYGRGAGMLVTNDTALQQAAVWSCVRVITETVASLPWQIVQSSTDPDGQVKRQRLTGGGVDWVLNKQANPEMTAFSWREIALAHVLLSGNHYSEIQRDVMGRPLWVWPLAPETVTPYREEDGTLRYKVMQDRGNEAVLDPRDVLHVKGLGWDGLTGYSVITMARRSFGEALAMDEYGGNFYANGTHLGLVFKHPKTISQKAQDAIKKSLDEKTGPGKAFRALVLEEDMSVEKATMTMIDAQFVESRKRSVSDICRWFRVPPHKVADLERATFSNIEHQSIEFVQDTITPWCRRFEQEIDLKLFGVVAQRSITTRLATDVLLRGDFQSRMTGYKTGRDAGILSVNDCRALENLDPVEGGDMRLQPMNMVPLGTVPPEPAPTDQKPSNIATLPRKVST